MYVNVVLPGTPHTQLTGFTSILHPEHMQQPQLHLAAGVPRTVSIGGVETSDRSLTERIKSETSARRSLDGGGGGHRRTSDGGGNPYEHGHRRGDTRMSDMGGGRRMSSATGGRRSDFGGESVVLGRNDSVASSMSGWSDAVTDVLLTVTPQASMKKAAGLVLFSCSKMFAQQGLKLLYTFVLSGSNTAIATFHASNHDTPVLCMALTGV